VDSNALRAVDTPLPSFADRHWLLYRRQMTTQLRYPTLLRHTIDAYDAKGFANITATYCVPLAPGRSRVFVRQPFRFKSKLPEFFFSASRSATDSVISASRVP
jgi:Pheophorbide a oxygenase